MWVQEEGHVDQHHWGPKCAPIALSSLPSFLLASLSILGSTLSLHHLYPVSHQVLLILPPKQLSKFAPLFPNSYHSFTLQSGTELQVGGF